MRGYFSKFEKLPNSLTLLVIKLVEVSLCDLQAKFNAGGIPLDALFVSLLKSALSALLTRSGVVSVSCFFVPVLFSSLG